MTETPGRGAAGPDGMREPGTQEPEVIFTRRGRLAIATLNRPRAVNALNAGMVDALLRQFTEWADDDTVGTVLVRGAGGRGLCAGGDIVAIYRDILRGGDATAEFWQAEYRLNHLISRYPKPYVALMDGLVLGGGVGISAHGSVRVVTERTRTGMPETTIGFAPDVGGTLLLSGAPGETGTHAALTGAHLDGADAVFLGLADHYVPSGRLDELTAALENETAENAIGRFAVDAPPSGVAAQRHWIDSCYGSADAEEIVARLRAWTGDGHAEAAQAADTIEAKSPTSVKVTLASLRQVAGMGLAEALSQEYRVGLRFLAAPDFREGIRAQVVDKDRTPNWRPPTLAGVLPEQVERFFKPLGRRELDLGTGPGQQQEAQRRRRTVSETYTVAFLGLGHMGGPMAVNLARAGHRVAGFDVVPAAVDAARANGVPVVASADEAVPGADVVLTMFPSGRHVLEAYRGIGGRPGLLALAAPGTMFLDCSTINVDEAREAAQLALDAGHRSVDAPVSGGVVGAEAGTLTFMVGGGEEDFDAVKPLLEVMGKRIVHCGAHGAGQAAKVCNNLILGVSMIAVSEAFVLGEKLGLTHQALFDVASAASGQCWALTTNCPVPGPVPASPANHGYQPGFAGALMAKDLNLALNALNSTGVAGRMGPLAAEIYDTFAAEGGAGMDFSAIINSIRDKSGPAQQEPGAAQHKSATAHDDGSPE